MMFKSIGEGMFIQKMINFSVGSRVMVAHREDGRFGVFVGRITEFDDNQVMVARETGDTRSFDRKHYEFLEPPNALVATLDEAERALASRREGTQYVPPARIRASMRATENLRRAGTDVGTLGDPDKLAEALRKEMVVFGMLSEFERRQAASIVIQRMKLGESEEVVEDQVALKTVHSVVRDKKVAKELLNAIMAGSKVLELTKRFGDQVSAEEMGKVLVGLMRAGKIPRSRLRESSEVEDVARSVMNMLMAA